MLRRPTSSSSSSCNSYEQQNPAMSVPHSPAETGIWTDYTTDETWLVETATVSYALLAFVGVWLSFSAKYLQRMFKNLALYVHVRWHKPTPPAPRPVRPPGDVPTERDGLLERQESPARIAEAKKVAEAKKQANVLATIYKSEGNFREIFQELCLNQELTWHYWLLLFVFTILLGVLTVGFIALGVFLARINPNGPAILASEKCGLWVFDRNNGGDEAATRAGLKDLEKETRAGEYAQNCYGTPDMFDAIQCNFLYRSRLPFSVANYTNDCQFNNTICAQNQTVTFTTNSIDASEIGINSPHSPKFRRQTSCTPLSMEYPYIQNETVNGTTTYYYYYGEKPFHDPPVNYTYKTVGDPFDRLAPVYDVFAYTTNTTRTVLPYWRPRAELSYPEFSTLTLIFVSSLRIFYKTRNDEDPIFPANKEVYLPGERKPWFRNSNPRARPLACINTIEVCLGDGKTCWPMNAPMPKDSSGEAIHAPPEFWLMYASLLKTDIFNSIEKRLGRGLIAQRMVSQYFSEGLGSDHWVDEVQSLVATSHARTQINAWSIASGEDSIHEGKDQYIEVTRNKTIYGDLCRKFKFSPPGYARIGLVRFMLIILSLPVFWLISLKWSTLETFRDWFAGLFKPSPPPSNPHDAGEQTPLLPSSVSTSTHGEEIDVVEEPPIPKSSGQPAPHSESAEKGETGETREGAGAGDTRKDTNDPAGPTSSTLANIPQDGDDLETVGLDTTDGDSQVPITQQPVQEAQPQPEPAANIEIERGAETGTVAPGTTPTTDEAAEELEDIEWEPLLIEKLLEWVWLGLLSIPSWPSGISWWFRRYKTWGVWQWPSKLLGWLRNLRRGAATTGAGVEAGRTGGEAEISP